MPQQAARAAQHELTANAAPDGAAARAVVLDARSTAAVTNSFFIIISMVWDVVKLVSVVSMAPYTSLH